MTDIEKKERVVKDIKQIIEQFETISFQGIEQLFDHYGFDYRGDDAAMTIPGVFGKNVIMWAGWNEDAYAIVAELISKEGEYHAEPFDEPVDEVYDLFSMNWVIPVTFDCTEDFEELRWYPVVIAKDEKEVG